MPEEYKPVETWPGGAVEGSVLTFCLHPQYPILHRMTRIKADFLVDLVCLATIRLSPDQPFL